jgi:hypothetical protein
MFAGVPLAFASIQTESFDVSAVRAAGTGFTWTADGVPLGNYTVTLDVSGVTNTTITTQDKEVKATFVNGTGYGFAFIVTYGTDGYYGVNVCDVDADTPAPETHVWYDDTLTQRPTSVSLSMDEQVLKIYVNGVKTYTQYGYTLYWDLTKSNVAIQDAQTELDGSFGIAINDAGNQAGMNLIMLSMTTIVTICIVVGVVKKIK